jgi:Rrf2 family protein
MKLSTKGRYGTRLMLDLALHRDGGLVLLKEIATRQEISQKYLSHLIVPLKAAGLVNSSRGAHGGYGLAKPPAEITLAEILRAVEGDLTLVECVTAPAVCSRVGSCATRDVWALVSEGIVETLRCITLEDLIRRQRQKLVEQAPTWVI